jgi:hypothetical protein
MSHAFSIHGALVAERKNGEGIEYNPERKEASRCFSPRSLSLMARRSPGDGATAFRATALVGRETLVRVKAIEKTKRPIDLVFGSIA